MSNCKCNGPTPFVICSYCDNKFYNYLNSRNKFIKKNKIKNEINNTYNCYQVFSLIIYQCKKCTHDVQQWIDNYTNLKMQDHLDHQ